MFDLLIIEVAQVSRVTLGDRPLRLVIRTNGFKCKQIPPSSLYLTPGFVSHPLRLVVIFSLLLLLLLLSSLQPLRWIPQPLPCQANTARERARRYLLKPELCALVPYFKPSFARCEKLEKPAAFRRRRHRREKPPKHCDSPFEEVPEVSPAFHDTGWK